MVAQRDGSKCCCEILIPITVFIFLKKRTQAPDSSGSQKLGRWVPGNVKFMPMADPGFPREKGDTNSQRGCTKLLFLRIICRELHENERVLTERAAHVPMDPPRYAAAFGGYLFLGLFLLGTRGPLLAPLSPSLFSNSRNRLSI